MQTDGNLVLYGAGRTIWASGTAAPHARLFVEDDGDVVLSSLVAKWSARSNVNGPLVGDGARGLRGGEWLRSGASLASHSAAPDPLLTMQDDGNVVLYSKSPVWTTHTH
jgi:hypothetical protein